MTKVFHQHPVTVTAIPINPLRNERISVKDKFFLLLQINDALFPIGSYTQSYGLETYIQQGSVKDKESALLLLEQNLKTSFLHSELLAARLAYEYAKNGESDKIFRLEQIAKASRTPSELRSASSKLGSRFIKTVLSLNIDYNKKFYEEYYNKCNPVGISHSVAYGVFCACADMDKDETLSAYLYSQTSSAVTNMVKLIPLSQTVGQQILSGCGALFSQLLGEVKILTEDELCASAPGLDIRAMQHEVLYSRLYMS